MWPAEKVWQPGVLRLFSTTPVWREDIMPDININASIVDQKVTALVEEHGDFFASVPPEKAKISGLCDSLHGNGSWNFGG